MSTLIELSKKLKVRAEVLRERLAKTGREPPNLGDDLPDEEVHLLVSEFERPQQGRVMEAFARFKKRVFSKAPRSPVESKTDLEEAYDSIEDESPVDLPQEPETLTEAPFEIPGLPQVVEEPTPQAPPREAREPEPLVPSTPEQAPSIIPEPSLETPGAPMQAEDSPMALQGPVEEPVAIPPLPPPHPPDSIEETEASTSLLSSLGDLESVSESIADFVEPDTSDGVEGVEDREVEPLHLDESETPGGEEVDPDFAPAEVEAEATLEIEDEAESGLASSLTSEQLQARVDELANDLPTIELAAEEGKRYPHEEIIDATKAFLVGLSLKEKSLIAGAGVVAVGIFGTAITINRHNYGGGGDKRFYEEGFDQQNAGEFDRATRQYGKVLSRYPGSPYLDDTHFRLAEIARAREDYTNADRRMRSGIRAQISMLGDASGEWVSQEVDKRWDGLFFLGEVNTLREDWESSVDWFTELIEEATGTPYADRSYYRLANALYHRAKPQTAETWELRKAVEAYETALSASPEAKEGVVARLRLAELWKRFATRERGFARERLERALEYYEDLRLRKWETEAMGIDPLEISLSVGDLYRELGRVEESIRLYRALFDAPRDEFEEGPLPHKVRFGWVRSLLVRAEAFADEDPTSASTEADLSEALELLRSQTQHPFSEEEMTQVVYLRGHAYYHLGGLHRTSTGEVQNPYYLKMESAYQSGLSRNDRFGENGDDSLLASMRRTNYLFAVNQDYGEAARSYADILEKFPNSRYSYRARYRLAQAYFALEQYENASAEFEKVVESFTSVRYIDQDAFRNSYFKLGYCRFRLEDFGGAARTYKTLLALLDYEESEEALKAWKRLAWSYYKQGLYDEAEQEYRAFLARYPEKDTDGSVRVSLGNSLLQRFDHEQARAEFEQVIGEHPMSEMARWSRYQICESYIAEAATVEEERRSALIGAALEEAEAIRRDYPDEDRVLAILGRLYFEIGDYTRAVRELEYHKYSTRNTRPAADLQLRLAEAYYRLEDYSDAIVNFGQIDLSKLSRDEAARALFYQAESQRLGQRLPESIETYNRMIEQYPTSPLKELAEGRVEEVTWNLSKGLGTGSP